MLTRFSGKGGNSFTLNIFVWYTIITYCVYFSSMGHIFLQFLMHKVEGFYYPYTCSVRPWRFMGGPLNKASGRSNIRYFLCTLSPCVTWLESHLQPQNILSTVTLSIFAFDFSFCNNKCEYICLRSTQEDGLLVHKSR